MDWSSFFVGAVAGVIVGSGALLTWALCAASSMADDAHCSDPYMPEAEGTQLGGEV